MMPQKRKALGGPLIETKAYLIILIRQLKRKFDRQLKIWILIFTSQNTMLDMLTIQRILLSNPVSPNK